MACRAQVSAVPRRRSGAGVSAGDLLGIIVVPIEAGRVTVQLRGELDIATAAVAGVALEQQLARGYRFVRLDLSQLTFLDCAGLRMLVHAHNDFLAAAGSLVLTGVGPRIARLLRIVHLDEALFVADGARSPRRVRHLVSVATGAAAQSLAPSELASAFSSEHQAALRGASGPGCR